jgi:ABC transport system ATP-binding/permease protein
MRAAREFFARMKGRSGSILHPGPPGGRARASGQSPPAGMPPLFDGLDLVIHSGDRLALVGRNGSGKSTLMKVMAGLIEPDRGSARCRPVSASATWSRIPISPGFATLGDFAAQDARPGRDTTGSRWRPRGWASIRRCRSPPPRAGRRRRAALAKLLAEAPELMLLDEPTNHLDIQAITWLEARLKQTRAAFVVISHDRAFLNALTRATLWVDRGQVRRLEQGFAAFEDWRDKAWAEEDAARHKLDRKIKAEARWAVEGISARRKRNQGRVRALAALRAERAAQIRAQGTAAMALEAGQSSGKLVIEARRHLETLWRPGDRAPLDLR